ncbi:transglutaminase domain-containing protein [Demequina gelatinilytica]|uniref:transglutaminase domain-containing protein n=1 Tax=Demequina gelatinilytica TaxID=1638980 RepID=UPI000782283C|nr:transglutaminase domain-containing protein [Demequina gelatinilytica]
MSRRRAPLAEIALASACAAILTLLAAVTLAGAYGADNLAVPALVATTSAVLLAALSARLGWGWGVSVLVAVAGYLVGALLLATPGAASSPEDLARAAVDVVTGPVVGWKGVVTLPAPLGTYEGVMVPAYALLYAGAWAAVSFALRAPARWWIGPLVSAATLVVAIVVGPSRHAGAIAAAGVTVPREAVVGVAAFATLLAWFVARAALDRSRLTGAEGTRARAPRRLRATAAASAVAMIAMALGITVLASSVLPAPARTVARTQVEATVAIANAETPLSTYRAFMRDAAFDAPLFTVEGAEGVTRVRLAVLPYFDGDRFTQLDASGAAGTVFRRLPASLGSGDDAVQATVTVQGLAEPWVPLVGELDEVAFGGDRASTLVDSFYYVQGGGSGIVAGGLEEGDVVEIAATLDEAGGLEGLQGRITAAPEELPASLVTWVEAQGLGQDGASLLELIDRLRSRGYVSHDVVEAESGTYAWQTALGGHDFASSQAGHSIARLELLFSQLNERADEVGDQADADLLVAAVGDDEQFAAASALLARYLGFDARVVVGARLAETDPHGWTPPVCDDGECAGRHMSAWIEVATASGWVAVDTSPQTELGLLPEVATVREPELGTDLRDEEAAVIDPPSSQRSRSGESVEDVVEEEAAAAVLSHAWRIVLISGVGLLALVLPLMVLIAWKAARRARRRGRRADDAIRAGWQQYLDDAADAGLPPAGPRTYSEVSQAYGSPHGAAIAALATKVDFSHLEVGAEERETMWRLVREDRRHWLSARSWGARIRMRLSLRSLLRDVRRDAPQIHARTDAGRSTWKTDRTAATRSRVETRSRSRRTRRKGGSRD